MLGKEYSFPADIWSAGVTMYKMLTGEELFTCNDEELDHLVLSKLHLEEYVRDKMQKIDIEERFVIEMMLKYDANERLTATQALRHLS